MKEILSLEALNIIKDFPGARALDGVSLEARRGEVHAIVGENGAGKSTLIKILAGVHPYGSYQGDLFVGGNPARFNSIRESEAAGIGVIHQELILVKYMTVAENIFLGDEPRRFGLVDYEKMNAGAEEILNRLNVEIDPRAEVFGLGVGMQQMVELAKAIRKNSRILVLDEPTAALSDREVEVLLDLMRELRAAGNSLIYISHKLDEVFSIADRITVLRDGKTVQTDAISSWTRESVIRAMVGRELTDMFPKIDTVKGDVALEVDGLSVESPDVPGKMILNDVSLSVRKGEILGIAGLMGAGRTELLQTIFGLAPGRCEGKIKIGGKSAKINSPADAISRGVALVPEDRKQQGLVMIFSILENLSMAHLDEFCSAGIVDGMKQYRDCMRISRELDVKAPSLDSTADTLSGGNQQKVVLGKWLIKTPKILLLDEPTRGIDVGAKAEIHRLVGELAKRGMAVVMASSELPELLAVSDRVLVLRQGCVSGEFSRGEATPEKIMEAAA